MKLREDMKKKQGAAFSLEKFHDDFLKQGFPPIKIVREAMLETTRQRSRNSYQNGPSS